MAIQVYVLVFAIPAIAGALLLRRYYLSRHSDRHLYLMAGLLTLKPVLTTPIWFAITTSLDPFRLFLSILPGASLTALAVLFFRSLILRNTTARVLLLFDCVRWLNSFLLLLIAYLSPGLSAVRLLLCMAVVGWILPTAFAMTAYSLSKEWVRD